MAEAGQRHPPDLARGSGKFFRSRNREVREAREEGGHQARLTAMADTLGQPRRHRRLRVHRVRRARPEGDGRAVRAPRLQGDRAPPPQERDPVPPGRDQLHRQRRARFLRAALRAPARPEHLRHRLPRAGREGRLRALHRRSAPGATPGTRARASSTFRRSRASAIRSSTSSTAGAARTARRPATSATSASSTWISSRLPGADAQSRRATASPTSTT